MQRPNWKSELKKKILLVDDEENVLTLVSATLGYDQQYDLLFARDGREAMDLAQQERPDLAIVDMMMPEIDGCEVCRVLKADPVTSHTKVLMLTAMAQQADREKALLAGAREP